MPGRPLRIARRTAVAATAFLVAACGGGSDTLEPASGEPSGALTVLAAASLTESFTALESALEQQHPGLDISISFGPSSGLVEQVLAGAPADVLATANVTTMDDAVAGGAVADDPVVVASNVLTLAVPVGNPAGVASLADLARDDLRIALCEPQVPCGAATGQLLDIAAVDAAPDTLENDVKDVTGKVALGEVDAALIYRTDAAGDAERIETVDVPEADRIVNDYPVAILRGTSNRTAAEAFVGALTGEPGQDVLTEAGFVIP
jgi:molybdenum ABC transporter molybdate-binding protein